MHMDIWICLYVSLVHVNPFTLALGVGVKNSIIPLSQYCVNVNAYFEQTVDQMCIHNMSSNAIIACDYCKQQSILYNMIQ